MRRDKVREMTIADNKLKNLDLQQTPTLALSAVQTRNLRPLNLRSVILILVRIRPRRRYLWVICFHASSWDGVMVFRCLSRRELLGAGKASVGYWSYAGPKFRA